MNKAELWHNILKNMYPNLDDNIRMLENGPRVRPVLSERANQWCVEILEDIWADSAKPDQLNEVINWATEQLENWKNCTRMSYDMWYFKKKQDAEKFITLFHLKWPT